MPQDFQGPDFQNWPRSVDYRPRAYFSAKNDFPGDLCQFVQNASQNDRRLRALGSAWSISTPEVCLDYLVDTSGEIGAPESAFNNILGLSSGSTVWGTVDANGNLQNPSSPVLVSALTPATIEAGKPLVHLQAGTTLRELYLRLDNVAYPAGTPPRSRWALPTMGGAAGQTIAGAVSTSVHAGDFGLGPFPSIVRAIDVVLADGNRYWIERADRPITSLPAITAAFASDPRPPIIHYDTNEYLALLVSFGSIGVIYSLIIEIVEQFALSQQVGIVSWRDIVRPKLLDRTLLTQNPPASNAWGINPHPANAVDAGGNVVDTSNPQPFALEVILNPYRLSCDYYSDPNPDRQAQLVCRARAPISNPVDAPPPTGVDGGALKGAIDNFNGNNADSPLVQQAVTTIMTSARQSSTSFFTGHTITDTYDYNAAPGPLLSIEVVIPTKNAFEVTFIDQLLAIFDQILANDLSAKFAGILSIRYCQVSDAYLSMHNFGPEHLDSGMVCNIEIGCLRAGGINILTKQYDVDYGVENEVGLLDGYLCLSQSLTHLLSFEGQAVIFGVRLHWGQMSFSYVHNPQQYPQFPKWVAIRNQYTSNGGVRAFDTDFTTRYDISASERSNRWSIVADTRLPNAPTVAAADVAASGANYPPSTFLNSENCIEVFAVGSDGQVCWTRQPNAAAPSRQWSWVQRPDARVGQFQGGNVGLSPQFAERIAICVHTDSNPEVFAWCASDTGIYHAWRNTSDTSWNNWTQLKGDTGFASSPAASLAADGYVVVVARDSSNQVRWISQNNTLGIVGWNDWQNLPDPPADVEFLGAPCMALNGDGLLEAFVSDGARVWGISQTSPQASSSWGSWAIIGQETFPMGPPAVGRNVDQTLELFAVNDAGSRLFHIRQNPGNPGAGTSFNWTGSLWEPVVLPNSTIAISRSDRLGVCLAGGSLHVAARASDGTIAHYVQLLNGYSEMSLGGHFTSQPDIIEDASNSVRILAKFATDLVQQWQDTDARPNLLFYDPRTGFEDVFTIDGVGNVFPIQQNIPSRTTWYLVIRGQFSRPAFSTLFFYDPTAGLGEFYALDSRGNIRLVNSVGGLRTTWNRITPGNFTGGPFTDLLFYDPIEGLVEIDKINGLGSLSQLQSSSGWRNSWSQIVAANFSGSTYDDLLFYDPVAGEAELYSTDGHGNLALLNSFSGWSQNWIFLVPGNFTGGRTSDLFLCDPISGQAELHSYDGSTFVLVSALTGWFGWSFIVPGHFRGGLLSDLFLYNPVTGAGELWSSDGSGVFVQIQSYSGWTLTPSFVACVGP
jgi:hypothetical protein